MAKKNKETVTANNLRTANFAEFEANHEFTAESKLADFTRAAIRAGLTNSEIVEIGEGVYGEGKIKINCLNWYRSSDPELNPGKERYKATGAKVIEVKTKVLDYYNGLGDDEKATFVNGLVEALTVEGIIAMAKVDVLKAAVPAELFPVKAKAVKRELTEAEKLMKKQAAAEKRAAELRAELEALQAAEAPVEEAPVEEAI